MEEVYPYPVFLNLQDRPCLVVGGGSIASRKVSDLVEAGAKVTVVAEEASADIQTLASAGRISLAVRRWEQEDVNGTFLIFAATDDKSVNALIAEHARKAGAIVNAVDDPPMCDFISASVVKRGPLRIAVSTSGRCPKMAAAIRRNLESQFSENYGDFIKAAGELRRTMLDCGTTPDRQCQDALSWLCQGDAYAVYNESGKEGLWQRLQQIIST